jgi:hypothetical protein
MVFLSCEQRVRGGEELKGALAGNLFVPGHWEGASDGRLRHSDNVEFAFGIRGAK